MGLLILQDFVSGLIVLLPCHWSCLCMIPNPLFTCFYSFLSYVLSLSSVSCFYHLFLRDMSSPALAYALLDFLSRGTN